MLNNKLRTKYIRSFRDGGFVGSYINKMREVLEQEQPVSTPEQEVLFNQPQPEPQQVIRREPLVLKDRNINLQEYVPNSIQRQDSFNPNTITSLIPKIQQNLDSASIIESEKITELENIQKQENIAAELAKRTSNEYFPIDDYIPPPPKPTVPSLDEVGNLQEYLINQGVDVGKSGADGKLGTNTIKGLQRFLMKEGYDIGQNEGYGDDGILGSRTKSALEDYRSKSIPQQNEEDITDRITYNSPYEKASKKEGFLDYCEEEQCAQFVQTELSRNTRQPLRNLQKDAGVVGDAWRMAENIRKKGGTLLYDDYTGVNRYDAVKPGDVITMFTGGRSAYQDIANEETRNMLRASEIATHAGLIDSPLQKDSKGNFFYVVHNVHEASNKEGQKWQGRKYRNKVYVNDDGSMNMVGDHRFKVKQIVSPAFGKEEKIQVNPNIKIQPLENAPQNKVVNAMIKSVNSKDNQKKIMFDLGLTEQEYYDIAQAALGLIGQESKFGDVDKVPVVPGRLELLGKEALVYAGRGVLDTVTKDDWGETSLGFGRIKYNTNFKDIEGRLKDSYGISKASLSSAIDDGTNSIIATMFALGRRYNDLKRDNSLDDDERMYLAIQRYNRYNLDRPYGRDGKSSREYAKERDIDYVNKVLNFANSFEVTDGERKYNTKIKDLNRDTRIIGKQLVSSQR